MKSKLLTLLLLFSSLAFAQTVHFPGRETNNTFTGTNQFTVGAQFGPVLFASLPSSPDGTILFCTDCQALNPTIGGGTGAFVLRVNGQWLGAGTGSGGGSSVPGGVNTAVQTNDNGVLGGDATHLSFNKVTNTFGLPDGSTWSPSGLFPPTPTTNTILHVDSSTAQGHQFIFQSPTNGEVCLRGAGAGFNIVCVQGDTFAGTPPQAAMTAGDASSHYTSILLNSFGNSHADQLGYTFANGGLVVSSDLNPLPGCLFCVDRVNKSVHIYGPLYLPNGAGTGNSPGVLGAVPVSQGSSTSALWSSDISGPWGIIGTFGSCAGITPSASQSAFCFGPSGVIQGSFAGDTFQALVRANNIPAAGITGLIEPSQIDQTLTGLGGLYAPLNPVAQYNIPEWGATNVGPVTGPFNDAVDNIVTASKPLDLGSQPIAVDVPNCSSTGTTVNKLIKFSSSSGATCGVIASIADTQGEMGVCVGRCGTTGTGAIAYRGKVTLAMDGSTTVNDWVINSPSVAGDGRDTGSTTCPTSGAQVIGRVLSTNVGAGSYVVALGGCDTAGGSGGGGGSPGGSSGQIEWNNGGAFAGFTASGDATINTSTGVVTVTGINGTSLAGLATGLLQNTTGTGVPVVVTAIPNGDTATTQAANSNDTKIATDAYADRVIANPLFTGNTSYNILRNTADTTMTGTTATAISNVTWWTLPANLAANYDLDCNIVFNQNNAATALTWSLNDVTVAPTAGAVRAEYQAGSTGGSGTGVTWTTTGSKTVITFTPPSTAALVLNIHATWEQPSNASTSVLQLELAVTSGGTDSVTIKRDGLACRLGVTAN